MTEEVMIEVFVNGINVFLTTITPILLISIAVGLIISIFQAVTQIQEQTLTFAPKIIITFLALAFLFGWMIQEIADYTNIILTTYMGMI
ncbi:flagellar biosynthesis protein FliQ [Oceanotoga sp. DSM 15011]|jgi:flagellar biosynthetic protein FliQ|uniref:Flagellar biosynthetic protein FliQ n=1 Tax=Oceanotoga teriensis TaxID=515440 RepID=A0AA45C5E5_9BACT|nr:MULTISPECIES: flagellar biosynthesis protein FliQ [Oceanotoga]MDN5342284.1 flagellar biosynthesis protein FliQ [Oceanotoga sp.]MDO7977347.1 flagellar biosynthesis protein FliQ [Oceanotoga teriensis]PWJ88737.1 flagellar biosynthetic protein FliQ [Oceanotoga teriensis]UYP00435.1 flagellar biosynthesis protein FliQ [Oceanotoga sp. DSM 15011]